MFLDLNFKLQTENKQKKMIFDQSHSLRTSDLFLSCHIDLIVVLDKCYCLKKVVMLVNPYAYNLLILPCYPILLQYVFDYQAGDVFGCVADIGWITGHSYVVYGPLSNGATTVLFESTPVYPDPGETSNLQLNPSDDMKYHICLF